MEDDQKLTFNSVTFDWIKIEKLFKKVKRSKFCKESIYEVVYLVYIVLGNSKIACTDKYDHNYGNIFTQKSTKTLHCNASVGDQSMVTGTPVTN